MKVIIFGANGQDGYYLSALCQKRGFETIRISRNGPWLHGDVLSQKLVEDLVKNHRAEMIFHLAATSTTRHDAIYQNHATIGSVTINILERLNVGILKQKYL